MFDFQKLEVYKKAKLFHQEIKVLIAENQLSHLEKDQLYRASFSIALNLAEGSGRFSKRDRKNFFVIARSSVFECVAILDIL
jgi:four helix bundle protein